jgi:hypothetical protein
MRSKPSGTRLRNLIARGDAIHYHRMIRGDPADRSVEG